MTQDDDSGPISLLRTLPGPQGHNLAYHCLDGQTPGILFLGGFRSDMSGTKAVALDRWCRSRRRRFLRLDYSGHGRSGGRFEDGCIGDWLEDAAAVLNRVDDELGAAPWVMVGSSMGGWISLLLALRDPSRVRAIVTIAAATDFTQRLLWARLDAAQQERLRSQGRVPVWSPYEQAFYPLTQRLFDDGQRHLLLDAEIALDCPVRLLHGMADPDVPWQNSVDTANRLRSRDVQLRLIKHGDHSLSQPADLDVLFATLDKLLDATA